jgi:hypothetical protein
VVLHPDGETTTILGALDETELGAALDDAARAES